ncbi:MAG: bacillithiol biosynthesis deacetylase BshB1 [Fulvivirga sp.]
MKLDILAFAAHPDDTELACAGILATHIKKGYKVGVVDLTRGELGTRGTAEIRDKEARKSAELLGLTVRENLGLEDGFFRNSKENQLVLVQAIRKYQPDIVLLNAPTDRHPDHGRAAQLELDACFVSGLTKVEVSDNEGQVLQPWRPKYAYHYIQSNLLMPDIVIDVSNSWELKMDAIRCFASQFYDPNSNEPETFISSPEFMKLIEARGKEFGHAISAEYGEGLIKTKMLGTSDLFDLK